MKNKITGEWSGLLSMINKKVVDAGVTEFAIIPQRYEIVDFLRPLITTKYVFYILVPS